MANWKDVLSKIQAIGSAHDVVRRDAIRKLSEVTQRNVIVYYSGWLQKPELAKRGVLGFDINDSDKNGFMATINGLDRAKGLDLVLHTPGGEIAATESLVHYLRQMFKTDIRAIVPQIAMSAGTMIACSCKEILMGKHSNIGPIDPQFGGIPAHGIVEEFERAKKEIAADPKAIPVWQPIIARYHPTLIGECEKAIKWSEEIVREWLLSGMLAGETKTAAKATAKKVIKELGSHALTLSHARHLTREQARDLGLKIVDIEKPDELQDAILTVHHACVLTLQSTGAFKIIENQNGTAHILLAQPTIQVAN
jgi:ATP-dependent protease ClpP protease subunit